MTVDNLIKNFDDELDSNDEYPCDTYNNRDYCDGWEARYYCTLCHYYGYEDCDDCDPMDI